MKKLYLSQGDIGPRKGFRLMEGSCFGKLLNNGYFLEGMAKAMGEVTYSLNQLWGLKNGIDEKVALARFSLRRLPETVSAIESARNGFDVKPHDAENLAFFLMTLTSAIYLKKYRNTPEMQNALEIAREIHERLYNSGKLFSLLNSGLDGAYVSRQELEREVSKDELWMYIKAPSLVARHSRIKRHTQKRILHEIALAASDLFYLQKEMST